jgi:hypothetical protein|eukprot:COSAG06_NODE_161_length_21630_cov_19.444661_17_plen_252_part_00
MKKLDKTLVSKRPCKTPARNPVYSSSCRSSERSAAAAAVAPDQPIASQSMDEAALLSRAVPQRCVAASARSSSEYSSVAKTRRGPEHLARVCERDFSLLMRQLGESTDRTLPAAAQPVPEAPPAARAAAPAPTVAAPPAQSRGASPRQLRRNAAACEARRKAEFRNPEYDAAKVGVRVRVDAVTLRAVGSVAPEGGPPSAAAEQASQGREGRAEEPSAALELSLSRRSLSTVASFEQASQQSVKQLYRVLG